MDIRDWPMGKIMQLPDHVFGPRYVIAATRKGSAGIPAFRMFRCALPEWTVIWEIHCGAITHATVRVSITLRLGDQTPVNQTVFAAMEPLMPCLECLNDNPSRIIVYPNGIWHVSRMKFPVHSMGRHIVSRHATDSGTALESTVALVISSIPKEVPDCLLSGTGKNL